jgi:sarcosine oxidase subunit alpha
VLLAGGAIERLIAFPGNDRPGVMLAGAAASYLHRYGVAVGCRPAFFVSNDEAYEGLFGLMQAGVRCAAVIDVRAASAAADRAEAAGVPVYRGAVVSAVAGRRAVRAVVIGDLEAPRARSL